MSQNNKKHFEITRTPITYGEYTNLASVQRHYELIRKQLIKKVQKGEKLRVAFYVLFDSAFSSKPLYRLMLEDEIFEPVIVIIPNISGKIEYLLEQMEKNYTSLSNEFEHVYKAYTEDFGFIDFTSKADLICFSNVYDHMTHELYTMKYAMKARVLTLVLSYGLYADYYAINNIINLAFYNSAWKNFIDTRENLLEFINYTDMQGKNTVLTGYGKMDALAHFEPIPRTRKKIIIAPHHTVKHEHYELSNFLEYSSFFLELPKLYPNIDFIFRPHPLLFSTLKDEGFWSQEQIDQYLLTIANYPNMEYQDGGDYFETFANSDALIHDSASFKVEYLYTNKPCCFIVKNEAALPKLYTKLGLACLDQHELAYNSNNIINFIDEVVINGIDTKKAERIEFAKKHLMINYPHASDKILEHIKQELNQNEYKNNEK